MTTTSIDSSSTSAATTTAKAARGPAVKLTSGRHRAAAHRAFFGTLYDEGNSHANQLHRESGTPFDVQRAQLPAVYARVAAMQRTLVVKKEDLLDLTKLDLGDVMEGPKPKKKYTPVPLVSKGRCLIHFYDRVPLVALHRHPTSSYACSGRVAQEQSPYSLLLPYSRRRSAYGASLCALHCHCSL